MRRRFIATIIVTLALLLFVGGLVTTRIVHNHKLANELVQSLKKPDISVTIIEGKRWEEIAASFAKAGVANYQDFVTIMQAHPEYEGTLFPDTYRFFANTPASDVITKMRDDYAGRTTTIKPTAADLALASIVERESLNDADRATIAGVYSNRLKVGMDLQADPTVEYSKDTNAYKASGYSQSFTFWGAITQADYRNTVSPFNTYLNAGLPPHPICNPGLKSIEAAQNPLKTDYLFFGYKDGKLLLAKTLAQHQAQLK